MARKKSRTTKKTAKRGTKKPARKTRKPAAKKTGQTESIASKAIDLLRAWGPARYSGR